MKKFKINDNNCTLTCFPNFLGKEGPMWVEKWMIDLDQTFRICKCTEDKK